MSKGKWTPASRERARQREELKLSRIQYELNNERRTKLLNFDTWFNLSCEIAKKQKFDWYKQIRLFHADHWHATQHIIKLHNHITENEQC
jgi:hypothetical protein